MARFTFLLIVALICSWPAAKAQEPDGAKIRQNWAFPDCGNYSEALIFTRAFQFRATRGGSMAMARYSYDGRRLDGTPATIENDGVLRIETNGGRMEYSACPAPPSVVPRAMQRLLRYIDRIDAECRLKLENDCLRVVFKLADDDSDGQLSPLDIRKAVTSMMLFSALAAGEKPSAEALARAARTAGQDISDDLIARYDSDASGGLDYNELTRDFSPPQKPVVRDILEKSGKLIPAFGHAAAGLR